MNKLKKFIPLILVIFLVITITAGTIVLSNLTPVTIPAKEETPTSKVFEGNLTCDCNGQVGINCGYLSETEIDQNDLEGATISYCDGTEVTNIKLEGTLIQENEFGDIDTDEAILNKKACIKSGGEWDSKIGTCNEPVGEIGGAEI